VLVERSLHPRYLSNAYLVADEEGGAALYVDSGAPLEPLRAAAERWRVRPAVVLRTHSHADHVEHEGELGLPVQTGVAEVGGLRVEALATLATQDDMVAPVSTTRRCSPGTPFSSIQWVAGTSSRCGSR
jgi:glyoxylase-like metal-dependent hydrolase (beta-lactamase superfamily II)